MEDRASLRVYVSMPRVAGQRAEKLKMTDLPGSIFLRLAGNTIGGETP
jgi:hypothetical protein